MKYLLHQTKLPHLEFYITLMCRHGKGQLPEPKYNKNNLEKGETERSSLVVPAKIQLLYNVSTKQADLKIRNK